MQTSRAGTCIHRIVKLIFDDQAEYDSAISVLRYFAENMPYTDRCAAIDMKYIVQSLIKNYVPSDSLYKGRPTTFLSDDKMQCLINIAFTAIWKWKALIQQNP